MYATTAVLASSTFTRVSSAVDGGAVWAATSALVTDSAFTNAFAAGSGGGMMCSGASCNATVLSSTFANCTSTRAGGTVMSAGTVTLGNSTITDGTSATVRAGRREALQLPCEQSPHNHSSRRQVS